MGVRRLLGRKVSVEQMLEFGLWVGVVHVLIGLGVTVANYDAVRRLQLGLQPLLLAGSEVASFGLTTLMWPLVLLGSAVCTI